ncbi:hypothetical protein HED60_16440 [Planctomycetales bacterium ZRK34]|nr:hypothetical protein HED60_16440 [Planctomycetales bacterium ZRK34]
MNCSKGYISGTRSNEQQAAAKVERVASETVAAEPLSLDQEENKSPSWSVELLASCPDQRAVEHVLWLMNCHWSAAICGEVYRHFRWCLAEVEVEDLWNRMLEYWWRHADRLQCFTNFEKLRSWCRQNMYAAARRRLFDRRKVRMRSTCRGVKIYVLDFGDLDEAIIANLISQSSVEDELLWEWGDGRLVECYDNLPCIQRECIDAVVIAGMSASEAGRLLHRRASDVAHYVRRGLESLRRRYVGEYVGTRGRDFIPTNKPSELGLRLWVQSVAF